MAVTARNDGPAVTAAHSVRTYAAVLEPGVVIGRPTRVSQKSPTEWRTAEDEKVHASVSRDRGMRCPGDQSHLAWCPSGEEGEVTTAELLAVFCFSGECLSGTGLRLRAI